MPRDGRSGREGRPRQLLLLPARVLGLQALARRKYLQTERIWSETKTMCGEVGIATAVILSLVFHSALVLRSGMPRTIHTNTLTC